jgi:hypothetical protein
MKKLMAAIYIPILLIFGFGILLAALCALAYGGLELVLMTVNESSLALIILDIAVVGLVFWFVTRKFFWSGLREIWKQIFRNL